MSSFLFSYMCSAILENGNIAFLDDHTAPIQPRVGSVIPSCKGQSYCEDVPNYPTNLVKDIIARNPHLVNYTSVDMVGIHFCKSIFIF